MSNPQKIIVDKRSFVTHYIVPLELVDSFTLMVRKALNAWPDAHPALKEFGDILMHGKSLQDYYSQRTDIKSPKHPDLPKTCALMDESDELPICSHCGGNGAHHMHNCKILTGA